MNRRAFFLNAEPILALAKRSKTPYSIAFLDIDHFKTINDSYGHDVGDEALKHFANILRDCYRDYDIVARFGGEEFTALLPGTDAAAAATFTQRVRTAMNENPVNVGDEFFTLKLRSGIASSEIGNDNLKYLISIAGKALSDAKTSGRDRKRGL
ncbi:diguanylate cyclase [Luminiphilus syltensis NOR5-1B]|uniref:diguanylate cyclase n=1 Tax=Luminiphilus syltensis NOR5-1B TaxID=565045 RepID=B8KQS0_9GAMM|nr:diguanylate cyclase [Luminiphilus syltensis NOR5-1B]